jgi:hypothetical protein
MSLPEAATQDSRRELLFMPPFASFPDRSTSVSDKEYFPYERSAAARSHAAGTPGHAPEGVLAVVCLDNPRDNTRGKVL